MSADKSVPLPGVDDMGRIISHALLDRYLRATGWSRVQGGWERYDRAIQNSSELGTLLDRAQRCLGDGVDLRARLGVLAAAEHEREQMNEIHDRDTMTITSKERIRIDERMRSYQDLLTLAGVDPEAWEKAR